MKKKIWWQKIISDQQKQKIKQIKKNQTKTINSGESKRAMKSET